MSIYVFGSEDAHAMNDVGKEDKQNTHKTTELDLSFKYVAKQYKVNNFGL
jgi:hypothetical protein